MLLIQRSQVGLATEISQEKENKSHTLQPGNTLYISEVSSSVDGCQLGKHLSPLPVCESSSQTELYLPTYGPCSLCLRKMIQTVGRAARVSVALNRLRIVCVHFYIQLCVLYPCLVGLGQGCGSLRCLCTRHS